MEHQVFISYSSQDKAIADRVCGALENAGVSCWIAPRDIEAGADFPSAIIHAITEARVLVVLLTSTALASPHILSEIDHAFNERKRMVPVRLSSASLPSDFDYFLSTQQWLDASSGFTNETQKSVLQAVSAILAGKEDVDPLQPSRKRTSLIVAMGILLAGAAIFAYSRLAGRPTPESAVAKSVAPPSDSIVPSEKIGPSESSPRSAGPKTWVNAKDGQTYVWVRPGSFTMGCSAADNECQADEKPAHRVMIPAGFWLAQTEVTNAAYRKTLPANVAKVKGDAAMPIRDLSWPDAKAYCAATGGRLPTEAEWEYAARGGSSESYYGVPSQIAWYEKNSGDLPHPVGMKEPNSFGLYDMLGNVSEWVLDRYYNKYDLEAAAVGPHIDQPLARNATAVARGGFWGAELPGIRVSHRAEMPSDEDVESAGVRCANDHPTP